MMNGVRSRWMGIRIAPWRHTLRHDGCARLNRALRDTQVVLGAPCGNMFGEPPWSVAASAPGAARPGVFVFGSDMVTAIPVTRGAGTRRALGEERRLEALGAHAERLRVEQQVLNLRRIARPP